MAPFICRPVSAAAEFFFGPNPLSTCFNFSTEPVTLTLSRTMYFLLQTLSVLFILLHMATLTSTHISF